MSEEPGSTKARSTRSGNCKHPAIAAGLVAPTRKRRTKAEKQADDEAKLAAREAADQAKQAKIQRVAELEENIAQEDSVDDTPRPRPRSVLTHPPQKKPLQRQRCLLDIQSTDESDTNDLKNGCVSDPDFFADADPVLDAGEDTETEGADTEEEARPKKKAKDSKPTVREAIDKARDKLAAAPAKFMKSARTPIQRRATNKNTALHNNVQTEFVLSFLS